MSDGLAKVGIRDAYEGALRFVGNPELISRTHFARFLVETGVCKDTSEVFRKFLTEGKPGFVPHRWANLRDAVTWIGDAGGLVDSVFFGSTRSITDGNTVTDSFALFGDGSWAFTDALVLNVDRSWRNPNLLRWHGDPWLIDHGASLYFHHDWARRAEAAARPYPGGEHHVLLPVAGSLPAAHDALGPLVTRDLLAAVLAVVPDGWLVDEPGFASPADVRAAYVDVLADRVAAPSPWLDPVEVHRAAG